VPREIEAKIPGGTLTRIFLLVDGSRDLRTCTFSRNPNTLNSVLIKQNSVRLVLDSCSRGIWQMGDSLGSRLAYCYTVLRLIDRRRAECGNDGIGAAVERRILDRELRELEHLAAAEAVFDGSMRPT
jgi:hypothetical protein